MFRNTSRSFITIKYVRPDISIPEEFLEAEYLEELSVAAPLMIAEVLVTSPPIEKVICFSTSVPSLHKVDIIPISTVLIQHVSSVRSGTPSPIIATSIVSAVHSDRKKSQLHLKHRHVIRRFVCSKRSELNHVVSRSHSSRAAENKSHQMLRPKFISWAPVGRR